MTDTLPVLVPAQRSSPEGGGSCRTRPSPAAAPERSSRGRVLVREVALLAVLMLVYQGSRLLGGRDVGAAFDHAETVLEVERYLRLPAEQDIQALLVSVEPVVRTANSFYAAAHLPVTGLALLWLLWVLPETYMRTRRALVASTGVALAVYLLLPVAPPRMLPGFVDTAAVHGQSVYGDAGASAFANQYAALPSLHVGWAVLVALSCITAGRSRLRWLWLAHPAVAVVVVVVTANHFWLDAAQVLPSSSSPGTSPGWCTAAGRGRAGQGDLLPTARPLPAGGSGATARMLWWTISCKPGRAPSDRTAGRRRRDAS